MANTTPPSGSRPWDEIIAGPAGREPVAPSKPPAPTTGSIPVVPRPIEADDADLVAPVPAPPHEEIMPTIGGTPHGSTPERLDEAAASAALTDPIRDLGDAAVHRASLQAAGVRSGSVAASPVAGHVAPSAPLAFSPVGPAAMAARSPSDAEPRPDSPPPLDDRALDGLGESEPTYTPPFGVAIGTAPSAQPDAADGDAGDAGSRDEGSAPEPWWRSTPFLVIVGLLVMTGVGYVLYLLFAPMNEPVALTPPVLVEPAASATIDPIAIEEPTAFQAAMPATVGAYALTGIATPAPEDAGLEVRAAEVDDLTYSDGTTDLAVRAIQHYDAEDAAAQFEALAATGSERQPVEAGGTQVGERASVTGETGDSIVWSNGTAVFVLTGPADQIEQFYELFPL
ncbi:hypothetical protein [Demequina sp. NBRC 110053]|uniref:hypothetical protein n=1 Tax=Demequina sp. NBRC 110053 TaxID=1570342 RepID=UPI0009FBF25E|nr:hypothetical protein [Demequina sp. NBRC 110053]